MIGTPTAAKSKILTHLRKLAPFSVVERGVGFATNDNVSECSYAGHTVTGHVREDEVTTHSVQLVVLSSHDIEASCSCSTATDMQEQWCAHAVALLWRAAELEFFEPRGGFGERESTFRANSSSPLEVANAIRDIQSISTEQGSWDSSGATTSSYAPSVSILLDLSSDRLGIKIFFDEVEQEPTIFDGFRTVSSRALDNILLQVLEDEGSWDDASHIWYINSSKGIELVLGLIEEYETVLSVGDSQPITLSHDPIGAKLLLTWQPGALELRMKWVIGSDDKRLEIQRTQEVFGTGPFWTMIKHRIYRLTPQAARIASIFDGSRSLTVPRAQVGPVLEALNDSEIRNEALLEVSNPELQPAAEIKTPVPMLQLERRDNASDHFTSNRQVELIATLDFEYPTAQAGSNVVFLRDRDFENEATAALHTIGFSSTNEKRRYALTGDAALDFIHDGNEKLTNPWKINGIDAIRKGMRFSELNIAIALASNTKGGADTNDEDLSSTRRPGAIDWFDCHVSVLQNNSNLPLSALFKNTRGDNDRWTRLDSGAYARVPGGSIAQLRTILGMVDPNCRVSNTIKTQLSLAQAISLSRINDNGFAVSLDKRLAALSAKLSSFAEIKPVKATKGFIGELRNYQEDGISWLNFLHEFELGGILADEMGLGKTVQALAFFQMLRDKRGKKEAKKPILIVAPTSVITNWTYEIRRFTPGMKSIMLHGPGRKVLFDQVPDADFVLTSYALLRLDRYELERFEFSYLVLDEAQNIKNPQATTTKAAKAIRARRRLAITGTPTENRPMELWSIMDFLMPGYLGSAEFFRSNIERPILEGGNSTQVAQMLNAKTRPFILRRLKADVEKELPAKIESVLHVDMTPSQRTMYNQILNEVRPKVFEAIKKKGIQGASISILAALLRLRQVCNHPNSIEAFSDLQGYDSGKFNLLKDLTQEALDSGRKILLFSQFRGMLSIIRGWLDEIGTEYLYLDGATRNRQDLIDRFSQDDKVRLFLISLKAGGSGLNLMAADTVIIYDPWWNPAVESQAVDRAHRIGQSKTVSVYRLVTEESVEQKIMTLKAKKSKLVDALINENGLSTANLSKMDLESLFSPLPDASS
ncbi:MAG: DEAD/DEAH box helicase [Proteobacteria bacterium]|nr:DEAD/DEAH box helicase [Pseudomonadota bacterium]